MDEKPYLSIIIPAYNEAGRKGTELKKNIEEIGRYLGHKNISYEVIVVNDGSKDNTAEFSRNLAPLVLKLEVIDRKENKGKGYSVREGFLKARGKFRLITDADGATAIDNLEGFWKYLENGADVVIGSRDLDESKIAKHQPKWKEWAGDTANILIKALLGLSGIDDTQCGFKVFSEKAVSDIFPIMKVDRWGWDFEALILARKLKYEIHQVPVVWEDAGQSLLAASVTGGGLAFGLGGYVSTLKELFQVKINIILGRYHLHRKEK